MNKISPNSLAAQGMALPPVRTMAAPGGSAVPVPVRPATLLPNDAFIPASLVPQFRQAWVSGWSEPPNQSAVATAATIQAALRAAEGGDTRTLFALYRDICAGGSHVQAEFGKRKMAMLAQPSSILPADKDNPDDVKAAQCIRQAIADCENWNSGLGHLLDSILYPVSVAEKIFRPGDAVTGPGKIPLRFTLKEISPVNYNLLCFKLPYLAPSFVTPGAMVRAGEAPETITGIPATLDYYPDAWEPDLRFYNTYSNGYIDLSWARIYPPDPLRHIVHRGHLFTSIRDNYGGPMRAVMPWWLLAVLGRDGFGRMMERYGSPFIVGKTDTEDANKVTLLQQAFSTATKLFGLVVDRDTEIMLEQSAASDAAQANETYLNVCHREISKIIVGQDLSSSSAPTGMGSGVANLQSNVREDLRLFDQMTLNDTLQRQLFLPLLRMNGLTGAAPRIVWGGLSDEDTKMLSDTLMSLSSAGFEPEDEALPTLSERLGFNIRRKAPPEPVDAGSRFGLPPKPKALSALNSPREQHPVDVIAAKLSADLSKAFKGRYAPVRQIILSSGSAAEAREKLAAAFPDMKPGTTASIIEEAMQICAAHGAAAATEGGKS